MNITQSIKLQVLAEILRWSEDMYHHYDTMSEEYMVNEVKAEKEAWLSVRRNLEMKVLGEVKTLNDDS